MFFVKKRKRKTKYYYSHHVNEYIKENLKSNEPATKKRCYREQSTLYNIQYIRKLISNKNLK